MRVARLALGAALALASTGSGPVLGDDTPSFAIVLKDHVFTPSEIRVPAGKRVNLVVKNMDATADEFDSQSLKVEKVIAGGSEGTIHLRPLDLGRYPFMGEFHAATAQGVVIAE